MTSRVSKFSRSWMVAGLILAGLPLAAQTTPAKGAEAAGSAAAKGADTSQTFSPNAQASTLGGTVVEDIVARVNDQIITRSDYDRAMQQLEADGRQQNWSPQEVEERKRDLLRDLIDQQLLLSKGKELDITGESELVRRLDEIRKQNHLDSMEALEKAAQQQGVSYEDFKQNIRNGIITQQVVRDEVGRRLQLTQTDVANFYAQHKDEFAQPESVHLNEILIPVATGGNPDADLAAAKAKADGLETQLKGGANFEALAKANSAGSTAAQGGDLGDFRRGMLAKELEEKTFSLQAGQYTEPIRTKQGYIILQVTQHVPGGTPELKTIEPQVEEAAYMSRMQPALRQYLTQLRKQSYVVTRPGYVDTAATPDAITPLYSAYTPPAPKKKVKFQRTRYRPAAHLSGGKSQVASAAGAPAAVEKPGKKEKIRFGQAPREALPPATEPAAPANGTTTAAAGAGGTTGEAGAGAPAEAAGSGVSSTTDIATAAEPPAPAAERKTRFSDRAREPKPKKAKTADQIENANVEKITPEEVAAQKTQGAPLGLAGDTATPKKAPKVKGEKTRFSDQSKEKKENAAPAQPEVQAPSPLATPPPPAPPAPSGNAPSGDAPSGAQP